MQEYSGLTDVKVDMISNRVLSMLNELRKRGIEVEIVDTAGWSREMIYEVYIRAATLAVVRGHRLYRVRRIFGSARDSGKYFGRSVPALLVFEGGKLVDVFPHEEMGRLITIEDFLESFLERVKMGRKGEGGGEPA